MFKLKDGRDFMYQWDVDRQLIVDDPSITEVHFCNRTDDCSLVVEVVDGLANVPNVILQKSFDIRVFGYDGKATRYDEAFKVKARTKPTDYVYTEVEIKRYEDLSKRIDEIEKNGISEEVITNAVENYLDEHPVDLTGYATEAYVDTAISNIPEVDLSKHALKSEIPTKVSQLQNDSKFITRDEVPQTDLSEYITESELNAKDYATEKYVDDAIANIDIPEGGDVDLSDYYTKEETDLAIYNSKDTYYIDFSNATTERQPATEEMIEFVTRFVAGLNVCAHIKDTSSTDLPRGWQAVSAEKMPGNNIRFIPTGLRPDILADNVKNKCYVYRVKEDSTDGWIYYRESSYSFTLTTKEYVDSLFEGIATAEGGAY